MRLATFTDYSLRVLIYLALKEGERATVVEISKKYNISSNHLVKVVHNLAKMNLINTYKGKGGGITLATSPSDLNIGKIIKALELDSPLIECFGESGNCVLNPSCKLKSALVLAQKNFYRTLESYTLEDIVKNSSELKNNLTL